MEYIPVIMVRNNMDNIPKYKLPEGFVIRNFEPGDEKYWAEIETAAGEFSSMDNALDHLRNEFGNYHEEFYKRCFFIKTVDGKYIGTATAWYNDDFDGERYGRLHWVGIHPDFQGLKLSKPLVGAAVEYLAARHDKAYLTSQTTSYIGIKVYLDFGFKPIIRNEQDKRAWNLLKDKLNHPLLK